MRIEVVSPNGIENVEVVHDLDAVKIVRFQLEMDYARGEQLPINDGSGWELDLVPRDPDLAGFPDTWGRVFFPGVPEDWHAGVLPDKAVPTLVLYAPGASGALAWERQR